MLSDFGQVLGIYAIITLALEGAIALMFGIVNNVADGLKTAITAMAGIYVALMGYALLSGWINMSMREAAVKLSKVILILLLLEIFSGFTMTLYTSIWAVPEAIANFIASRLNPLVGVGLISDFDALMNIYSTTASLIAERYSQDGVAGKNQMGAVLVWAIAMAPMAMMIITIMLAKVISALLIVIGPVIFGLSLFGFGNTFLMSWFKSILMTFLTVIIAYILGTVGLTLTLASLLLLLTPGVPMNLITMAPMGIFAVFSLVMITQSSSLAGAILGVAGLNTQSAQGFMQIAALQSAKG